MNTMACGFSSFSFRKQALFIPRSPFDLTYDTSCSGFIINGTEPPDTSRRIIFKIDDQLFKFGSNGLIPFPFHSTFNDVIQFGNTVEELLNISNIPEFVGKKVFPIIALDAPANSPVMPKINISIKVNSFNDLYSRYFYSPVYQLTNNARIFRIIQDTFLNGHATSNLECRIKKLTGLWTDWNIIELANFNIATAIQFRVNCALTTIDGSDEVKINSVTCNFTTNADLSTSNNQIIITTPQAYNADLKTVYALVKHSKLVDANIKAFVNLRENPKRRENLFVGSTTGEIQTIQLDDSNIAQDTISVFVGGKFFDNFYFDTQNSSITLQADPNLPVCVNYDFNFSDEIWLEMSQDIQQDNLSRFTFHTDNPNLRVFNVKFVAQSLNGEHVLNLGNANGKRQAFALPHNATNINCNGVWQYDELSNILNVIAPIDEPVSCRYNFKGNLPTIHEFICGASIL